MTSLLVPHDPASAAAVRRALVAELHARGVPDDVVDDAVLVMSELVGNAVRHGDPLPGGDVRASWWVAAGAVHLEVCDGGPGLDEALPTAVPCGAEGGRGLPIIDMLAACWGTTAPSPTGGVGVYAELPLPGQPRTRLSRGDALGGRSPQSWAARTAVGTGLLA
jgi:anti-sigma regulatory factor (Ser/Thr protein kinase)